MSTADILEYLGLLIGAWSLGFTGGWSARILKRAVDSTH